MHTHKYVKYLLSLTMVLIAHITWAQKVTSRDFSAHFEQHGVYGCFVLFDQAANEYFRYNDQRCDSGFIPASTFKIPNSLIAMEEKIIRDTSQIIPWNGHISPFSAWNQDQTLRTAVKYSCVWAFVGFAEQVGIDKYKEYMSSFEYGNQDLSGPPTRFWLEGPFRISAGQQIEFLRRFHNFELPVSQENVDIVKDLIVLEQGDHYTLSGKTGGANISNTEYIMWMVGYVESAGNTYFYALNFNSTDFSKDGRKRLQITKSILTELKLIN